MDARRLTAVGFALAMLAEFQWAWAFLPDGVLQATLVSAAAVGFAIAAWGAWRGSGVRLVATGVTLAASAHFIYIFSWGDPFFWAWTNSAGWGVGLALPVAAFGAWGGAFRTGTLRYGLFAAAAAAVLWILGDAQAGVSDFMIGNVLAPIGWALAGAMGPAAAESG